MYQSYFGLNELPFSLTPNTALFHALPPHLEAIQTTLAALEMEKASFRSPVRSEQEKP